MGIGTIHCSHSCRTLYSYYLTDPKSISAIDEYLVKMADLSSEISLKNEKPHQVTNLLRLAEMRSLAEPQKISMRIEVGKNVSLLCDESHMVEVFVNVVNNAIEAMRGEGEIIISDKKGRSKYELRFKDHGDGISKELLRDIFMPLFSSKRGGAHHGIGLAYCKNVINKHGGRIYAESTEGKGATIVISLPANRVLGVG